MFYSLGAAETKLGFPMRLERCERFNFSIFFCSITQTSKNLDLCELFDKSLLVDILCESVAITIRDPQVIQQLLSSAGEEIFVSLFHTGETTKYGSAPTFY